MSIYTGPERRKRGRRKEVIGEGYPVTGWVGTDDYHAACLYAKAHCGDSLSALVRLAIRRLLIPIDKSPSA